MEGIIYKITNKTNGKIYIGKTKEHYQNQPFGVTGRFSRHLYNAYSKVETRRNECPMLYNAIRKYGKENFKIEKLFNCELEECDEYEISTIKEYKSADKKIGYNIALGGGGRSVAYVSEEVRKKISNSQRGNKDSLMNIRPYEKNGKVIGYYVRRRNKGQQANKYFTKQKNTPEQNLEIAKEWLKNYKKTLQDNTIKYNKKDDLPRNITCVRVYNSNKIAGYVVSIMIHGVKYIKRFINKSGKETPETLLKNAITYKKSILKQSN